MKETAVKESKDIKLILKVWKIVLLRLDGLRFIFFMKTCCKAVLGKTNHYFLKILSYLHFLVDSTHLASEKCQINTFFFTKWILVKPGEKLLNILEWCQLTQNQGAIVLTVEFKLGSFQPNETLQTIICLTWWQNAALDCFERGFVKYFQTVGQLFREVNCTLNI